MDWNDRSLAGILPSYRWIFDNEGKNKISPSFDFANAYNGGNSLKFMAEHLDAGKSSNITLFATDLKIDKEQNSLLVCSQTKRLKFLQS